MCAPPLGVIGRGITPQTSDLVSHLKGGFLIKSTFLNRLLRRGGFWGGWWDTTRSRCLRRWPSVSSGMKHVLAQRACANHLVDYASYAYVPPSLADRGVADCRWFLS